MTTTTTNNDTMIVQEAAAPSVGMAIYFDGNNIGQRLYEDDGFSDSGFPGCQFRLHRTLHQTAVNVKVTGRTFQWIHNCWCVRIQIECVGDCEPSKFFAGWICTG